MLPRSPAEKDRTSYRAYATSVVKSRTLPWALLLALLLYIAIDKLGLQGQEGGEGNRSGHRTRVTSAERAAQTQSWSGWWLSEKYQAGLGTTAHATVPGFRHLSSSGSSSNGGHEGGHQHDALVFLFNALMIATGITHLTTLPRLQGLQQTVLLYVLGICFSLLMDKDGLGLENQLDVFGRSYKMWMDIDPHLLLFTMLPALLAGDAMNIDTAIARRVAKQCCYLAGPGVLINGASTGLFLWWYLPHNWNFLLSLVVGAILCATDPVSVVQLLKELGAPPTLTVQIQGESLLNDGTAIVLYTLAYNILRGDTYTVVDIIVFLVRTAMCAWGLGLVVGVIFFMWIASAHNKLEHHSSMIQISLSLSCAYWSFILAEGVLKMSGVLATVASALVLADKMWPIITSKESMHTVWHVFEYLGNSLIFFLAGALTGRSILFIPWSEYVNLVVIYLATVVIRGSMLFLSRPILRRFGKEYNQDMTLADTLVLTWSGLRGAVGLSLAIQVRMDRARGQISQTDADRVLFYVAGVAALTLMVNATTCPFIVRWLGVATLPETKQRILLMIHDELFHLLDQKVQAQAHLREGQLVQLEEVMDKMEDRILVGVTAEAPPALGEEDAGQAASGGRQSIARQSLARMSQFAGGQGLQRKASQLLNVMGRNDMGRSSGRNSLGSRASAVTGGLPVSYRRSITHDGAVNRGPDPICERTPSFFGTGMLKRLSGLSTLSKRLSNFSMTSRNTQLEVPGGGGRGSGCSDRGSVCSSRRGSDSKDFGAFGLRPSEPTFQDRDAEDKDDGSDGVGSRGFDMKTGIKRQRSIHRLTRLNSAPMPNGTRGSVLKSLARGSILAERAKPRLTRTFSEASSLSQTLGRGDGEQGDRGQSGYNPRFSMVAESEEEKRRETLKLSSFPFGSERASKRAEDDPPAEVEELSAWALLTSGPPVKTRYSLSSEAADVTDVTDGGVGEHDETIQGSFTSENSPENSQSSPNSPRRSRHQSTRSRGAQSARSSLGGGLMESTNSSNAHRVQDVIRGYLSSRSHTSRQSVASKSSNIVGHKLSVKSMVSGQPMRNSIRSRNSMRSMYSLSSAVVAAASAIRQSTCVDVVSAPCLLAEARELKKKIDNIPQKYVELLGCLPELATFSEEEVFDKDMIVDDVDPKLLWATNEAMLNLVYAKYWDLIDKGDIVPGTNEAEIILTSVKLALSNCRGNLADFRFIRLFVQIPMSNALWDSAQTIQKAATMKNLNAADSEKMSQIMPSLRTNESNPNASLVRRLDRCGKRMVDSAQFSAFIMLAIILNAVCIAVEDSTTDEQKQSHMAWLVLDFAFTVIFLVEFLLKFLAFRCRYFQNAWNVYDFALVLVGVISVCINVYAQDKLEDDENNSGEGRLLSMARVFRVLRVVRVIRLLKFWQVLKARMKNKELSLQVAERIQRLSILLSFIRAHVASQRDIIRYFGKEALPEVVEIGYTLLQSQIAVYKSVLLAVREQQELDSAMLREVNEMQMRKKVAEDLQRFVTRAHHGNIITAREADSMIRPLKEQIKTCQNRIRESHFGYVKRSDMPMPTVFTSEDNEEIAAFNANMKQRLSAIPSQGGNSIYDPDLEASQFDKQTSASQSLAAQSLAGASQSIAERSGQTSSSVTHLTPTLTPTTSQAMSAKVAAKDQGDLILSDSNSNHG